MVLIGWPLSPPRYNRVLVLGDSLTNGAYASDDTHAFRYLLAQKLGADLAGGGYYNLPTAADAYLAYLPWRADLIVLEVGINDAYGYGPNPLTSESAWQVAYGDLLYRMKAGGATVVAVTPFASFGPTAAHYAVLARYAGYIRQQAKAHGVVLADVWAASATCGDCISQPGDVSAIAPGFTGDGFHPNNKGHALIAKTILDALTPPMLTYLPLASGGDGGTIPGTIPQRK